MVHKADVYESVGIASSAALGGLVTQLSGGRLVGNAAQLGAGAVLGYLGGRRGSQVGKGILKKAAGDFIEDNLIPRLTGVLGGTSSTVSSTNTPEVL